MFLRFFDHCKIIENTPTQEGTKRIEMMMNSTIRNIENYEATIKLLINFTVDVELSKLEGKSALFNIKKYQHLKGVL